MSIAEKLITIAENEQSISNGINTESDLIAEIKSMVDNLPEAAGGGENLLVYATRMDYLFENAVFPDGYEITINAPNLGHMMSYMFLNAKGVRKITMNVPIEGIDHSAHTFAYGTNVEEIVFPDGIKFFLVNSFASSVKTLKSIFGRIDLSGSTNNTTMLNGCWGLENVSFMPNTIKANFTIAHSELLTDASIQSIIDGLAEVETAKTLTLNAKVGAKLTDEQKATITAKNWTLVY